MKHFLRTFIICIPILLFVGCMTNEEKANALIQDTFTQHQDYYTDYLPLATRLDTAYNVPINNLAVLEMADDVFNYKLKELELQKEINILRDKAYSTGKAYWDLSTEEVKEARLQITRKRKELKEVAIKRVEAIQQLGKAIATLDNSKVVGWTILHTFRYKNKEGMTVVPTFVILADSSFSTVIRVITDEAAAEYTKVFEQAQRKDENKKMKADYQQELRQLAILEQDLLDGNDEALIKFLF